jgi:DinB superfamily
MDKALIKEKIETVIENFKAAIRDHQNINIKRSDGGWSVGEIADHVIKSTGVNFGRTGKTERPYDQNAASIKELFLNFQMKFPAAPELQPESRQYTMEEIFSSLDRNKEAILKMIDKEDLTETCIDIELPGWGALTKYEWLVLMEYHTIRHTRQVTEFN